MPQTAKFFSSPVNEEKFSDVVKLSTAFENSPPDKESVYRSELVKTIAAIPLPSLIAKTQNDRKLEAVCQSDACKQFWGNVLEKIPNGNQEKKYQPMVTASNFDQVRGIFLYDTFLKIREKTAIPKALKENCLKSAAGYASFSALNALCIEGLQLMKTQEATQDLAKQIRDCAEKAALLYWTAGYFLLSNVYQELSQYTVALFQDTDFSIKKQYYLKAYEALCIAEMLEPYSAPMINNAFHGNTLWQSINLQMTSWNSLKIHLRDSAKSLLSDDDALIANNSATIKVEELKKMFHLEKKLEFTLGAVGISP
jgi:hypothetical protein